MRLPKSRSSRWDLVSLPTLLGLAASLASLVVVAAAFTIGCSGDPDLPALDDGRAALNQELADMLEQPADLSILTIKKTNGLQHEGFGGVQIYELEFEGAVRAERQLFYHAQAQQYRRQECSMIALCTCYSPPCPPMTLSAGTKLPFKGRMSFLLKENGWDLDVVSLNIVER